MSNDSELIANVRLSDDGAGVIVLDQTLLPGVTKYLTLRDADELHEAIYMLRVRGAPAIGVFAAYALYVLAQQLEASDYAHFCAEVRKYVVHLSSARPTAVNLMKQLLRMEGLLDSMATKSIPRILAAMRDEAISIQHEDVAMCKAISEHGLTLIREGFGILTHCNAGPLATSRYGTALGPILLGHERGMRFRVFSCETRPLLQGARLTAYELDSAGVDCTLICDNMASVVMKEGRVDAIFVGCDRVARNGDAANKIGTSALAVLAKHYGIPFYVFCPTSTLDPDCMTGAEFEIEQRPAEEIKELFFEVQVAPLGVKCFNPSFDVTDAELITAIVTEKGIFRYPYSF